MFRLTLLALSLGISACAANVDVIATDPPEMDPSDPNYDPMGGKLDSAGTGWTYIGVGVEYQQVNTGHAILIAYGGYSAKMSYSAAWGSELVDAKLGAVDVGQIYAVKGPQDPGYNAKEVQNSKLRAHLLTIDDGTSPIYIVAHSSGSYVAHELLNQLDNHGNTSILSRISYANLDGGGSGLSDTIVDELHSISFVYAHDTTLSSGYSENHSAETSLASAYAPKATAFDVVVPNTGCDNGAGWCLHDVLVTHRPHNPDHFDLARDYVDFVNRPVTTEYLDQFLMP